MKFTEGIFTPFDRWATTGEGAWCLGSSEDPHDLLVLEMAFAAGVLAGRWESKVVAAKVNGGRGVPQGLKAKAALSKVFKGKGTTR